MRLEGTTVSPLEPGRLWQVLEQPGSLAGLLSGVDHVELEGPDRVRAEVRPSSALGRTPARLVLDVLERRPPARVVLGGEATAREFAVTMRVEMHLDAHASGTRVRWSADVTARGALRSVGQRVLPGLFSQQIDDVLLAATRAA